MAALAVPATPAITASATRADTMVFMAISPMLWPIPRSRAQGQLFHSLIGAAVTEGTTVCHYPPPTVIQAAGCWVEWTREGPSPRIVSDQIGMPFWGLVFRDDLGSGVRYDRQRISLRRHRGSKAFCTQPNAEVRTLVNALEYQWPAGCPWDIHNVR